MAAWGSGKRSRILSLLRGCGVWGLILTAVSPGDRVLAAAPPRGRLSLQEKHGRQIYLRGISPSGRPITAAMGNVSLVVPASTLPCVNCHGFDGRGKPEGGVEPSNITWEALTKPYTITHGSGRRHPPYTERSIERAIAAGFDPAGNSLQAAMPRYGMAPEDMADLLAYLKRLGADQDPGLTETAIRIGTILPTSGPLAEVGQATQAVLAAYFAEINAQGGIYNRRLELRVVEPGETATGTRARVERFLEGEEIFALAGPWIAGAEKEVVSLMNTEEVPLVGPFTLFPQVGFPLNRHVFYVLSGLREQARVLVAFAAQTPATQTQRLALVYPESEVLADLGEVVEAQVKEAGWGGISRATYGPGRLDARKLVRELSEEAVGAVVFLGSGSETRAFVKEVETRRWRPTLLLPGLLAGGDIFDIPPGLKDKVVLAFPTLPSDQTRAGVMEFRALAEKHKLSSLHLPAQLSAYSAAKILVEGLKRAGREVSREKLITALEGLYSLDTGLTPPITYGPNRRIGALGAHIVAVDLDKKAFVPLRPWMTLE